MERAVPLRTRRDDDPSAGFTRESCCLWWILCRRTTRRERLSAGASRGRYGAAITRDVGAFRFADYATGETTLARDVWSEVPEDSLVIVDRNFLVAHELIHLESSGNRHWLSRAKTRTRYSVVEKLGTDDELVVVEVDQPGLPRQWGNASDPLPPPQVKGHPRSTLLTSLTDPKLYPGPRNWSSCTTSAGRPRSPTTRSRRTCSRGRRRFAVARPTVSGKSCGASLSPTTWCALKSNVQPQRRTCPRPESASSPPSPSCGMKSPGSTAAGWPWVPSPLGSSISAGTSNGSSCLHDANAPTRGP